MRLQITAVLVCVLPILVLVTGSGCGGGSSPVVTPTATSTSSPFGTATPTTTPAGNPTQTPTATSTPSSPIAARFDNALAFSDLARSNSGIYRADADGRNRRELVSPTALEQLSRGAAIRPDGREVAFFSNSANNTHTFLYVMNANGSNVRRVPLGTSGGAFPAWNPEGTLLAATNTSNGRLFVVRPDGSDLRFLSDGALAQDPTFSPDGQAIFFVQFPLLRRVSLLDGTITDVNTGDIRFIRSPRFSPGGKTLAFIAPQNQTARGVFLALPDGSGALPVPNTLGATRALWSPANELAVEMGGLFSINRDGTNKRFISGGFDFDWR